MSKLLALALFVAALLSTFAGPAAARDQRPFDETFVATALALKGNPTDLRYETSEEREQRVTRIATVLYDAADDATCGGGSRDPIWKDCRRIWAGKRNDLAFALLGVAYHETGFAAYVGLGRCEDGPKGSRCDNGKARTYLQVHRDVCPEVWESEGPESDIGEQHREIEFNLAARCAVRIFVASSRICSDADRHGVVTRRATWSEVLAKYAGRNCSDPIGVALEIRKIAVEQLWRKQ